MIEVKYQEISQHINPALCDSITIFKILSINSHYLESWDLLQKYP